MSADRSAQSSDRDEQATAGAGGETPGAPEPSSSLPPRLAAAIVFFASGAVLVLEVMGLRLVAPYVGVTLQTSTAVIGVALAAIAVGAWTGGRLADSVQPRRLIPLTLVLAGALTTLTLPLVRLMGPTLQGDDPVSITILAFLAVFAPCVFLAGVTPMVVKLQLRSLSRTGTVVGRLSGLGTLGAIIATFVTGFVLLAALPSSIVIVGLGTLTIVLGVALGLSRGPWRTPPLALILMGVFGVGVVPFLPSRCVVETAYHCARVVEDPARPTGRLLVLDTLVHSYVDLTDPTYLAFPYIQTMASVADVMRPSGRPLSAVHMGAGGLTLPRYLAATRPGSSSRVLEIDRGVLELDRAQLQLRPEPGLQLDVGDARVLLAGERTGGRDLVIGDAFGGIAVPWHLTTRETVSAIRRILRRDGIYAVNVIDNPPGRFVRAEVATISAVFPSVAVAAAQSSIAGQTGGNFVILASTSALPIAALDARLRERGTAATVVTAHEVTRFAEGAQVLRDEYAPVDQLITPRTRG